MRSRFTITLEPEDRDNRPDEVRLRGVLKALLRRHGLRCVDVREVPVASEVSSLLILAESERLIYRWAVSGSNAIHYANKEQLLADTCVSLSLENPIDTGEAQRVLPGSGTSPTQTPSRQGGNRRA